MLKSFTRITFRYNIFSKFSTRNACKLLLLITLVALNGCAFFEKSKDTVYEGEGEEKLAYTPRPLEIQALIQNMQIELLGQGQSAKEVSWTIGKKLVDEGFICFTGKTATITAKTALICMNAFCVNSYRFRYRANRIRLEYKSDKQQEFAPPVRPVTQAINIFNKCPENKTEKREIELGLMGVTPKNVEKSYDEIR